MKTVLITGASKGIGAEIARTLAKEGYNVAINFNKSESAAVALKNELEKYTSVMLVKADVSKYDEVASMVSAVRNKFGSITHLVCNAGISVTGLLEDMDLCQCDSVIDTNLKGVIYTVKEVIPDMVKRKSGVIVSEKRARRARRFIPRRKRALLRFPRRWQRNSGCRESG